METQCGYMDDKTMWVSTDEKKWIKRLLKLAAQHPDEVTIRARPEENDGCLYLKCPASWLKISPPLHRNLTDEQRAIASERMKLRRKTNQDNSK